MKLSKVIFKFLQKRYWGVGFESRLPPEFVITNHAKERLNRRLSYPHKHRMVELMIDAWHDGEEPPATFLKEKARKPRNHFHSFEYRYYEGYIWIWGLQYSDLIPDGQKYLVTIYNWRK